jgi:hypothetical protein
MLWHPVQFVCIHCGRCIRHVGHVDCCIGVDMETNSGTLNFRTSASTLRPAPFGDELFFLPYYVALIHKKQIIIIRRRGIQSYTTGPSHGEKLCVMYSQRTVLHFVFDKHIGVYTLSHIILFDEICGLYFCDIQMIDLQCFSIITKIYIGLMNLILVTFIAYTKSWRVKPSSVCVKGH